MLREVERQKVVFAERIFRFVYNSLQNTQKRICIDEKRKDHLINTPRHEIVMFCCSIRFFEVYIKIY